MGRVRPNTAFCVAAVLCALASAQPQPKPAKLPRTHSTKRTQPHLLTRDEGLSILAAALNTRDRAHGDCSHLVHALYQDAGFPYPYAPSSDLYRGIPPFRRVFHPQPGDVAVWRGHAAIVVSPAQHSFYGSTTSGLRVESSDLQYWQRQGPPRYFRYLQPAQLGEHSKKRTSAAKLTSRVEP